MINYRYLNAKTGEPIDEIKVLMRDDVRASGYLEELQRSGAYPLGVNMYIWEEEDESERTR